MTKEILRQKILSERTKFLGSPFFQSSCEHASHNIEAFLNSIPDIKKKTIGFYHPISGEVDITPIYDKFVNLAFPRLIFVKSRSEIEYASVNSTKDLSKHSKFNIKEPSVDCALSMPDIILIPGLAFDQNCNRLGYGRGHFDKFLSKCTKVGYNPLRIGVCFDFQLLKSMPLENHDQKMNLVITEKRILHAF